jgi:hypothetical protein
MNPTTLLSRRQAIARLGLVLGGTLIGGDVWLRGATVTGKTFVDDITAADLALLDEIGETIIPTTNTPGAKAAKIGAFMVMMVNDCYDDAHHAAFKAGLPAINAASRSKFGHDFMAATPAERTALLNELDAEQKQHQSTKAKDAPAHYFRMMRQLTIVGYFTSEIGATQALNFSEVPGRFDPDVAFQKGDRASFAPLSRGLF